MLTDNSFRLWIVKLLIMSSTNLQKIEILEKTLRWKSTDRSQTAARIIIRNVKLIRDHNISVGSVGECVSVGSVKVATSGGISGWIVAEVGNVRRVGGGRCPATLESHA